MLLRLIFSDLKKNHNDWTGLFLVAFFCGLASGWAIFLISSAENAVASMSSQLRNSGSATLALVWLAAFPISSSVSRLVEEGKEGTYSLWRLIGVRRWQIGVSFLIQIAVSSGLGLILGILLFWIFAFALLSSQGALLNIDGVATITALLFGLSAFVVGGVKSARLSLRASPIEAIRGHSRRQRRKFGFIPFLISFASLTCLLICFVVAYGSEDGVMVSCMVVVPLLVAIIFSQVARWVFSLFLNFWLKLSKGPLWTIAVRGALYRSAGSDAIQLPIMLGVALVSGLLSVSDVLLAYLANRGVQGNGVTIAQLLSFLGAPLLICMAGGVAVVIMASASRRADEKGLLACGVSRAQSAQIIIYEALAHSASAVSAGLLCAFLSFLIASCLCSVAIVPWSLVASSLCIFAISFFTVVASMLSSSAVARALSV